MSTVVDLPIPADHPAFAGHFPGLPIVPGVVLLDEALYAIAAGQRAAPARLTLTSVKFRRPVRPGERVSLRYRRDAAGGVRFELESSGVPVASGALLVRAGERGAHDD